MEINVVKGDITKLELDAIVNPANSQMIMGGGLAKTIRENGGENIQTEAKKRAPVPVGQAAITPAGKLKAKYVIHAPTMLYPGKKITSKNTKKAMKAVLNAA